MPPDLPDLGDAESFSDDTSVDRRKTARRPVAIYGQAMAHFQPHWIKILAHAVDNRAEVKGADAWRVTQQLNSEARAEVLKGVRSVRIHIVDARPYVAQLESIWRDVAGVDRTMRQIEEAARSGDDNAALMRRISHNTIAKLILIDSPLETIRIEATTAGPGLVPSARQGERGLSHTWIDSDLAALRTGGKSLIERVTDYAAKTGPLFSTASERAREAYIEDLRQLRYLAPERRSMHLAIALGERHRYDEGDRTTLDLMEAHRRDIRSSLREPLSWWSRHALDDDSSVKPLTEDTFDTTETEFGQAADVAARFAARWFRKGGTERVVSEFRYVSVNGTRMSESDARDYVKRWSDKVDGVI